MVLLSESNTKCNQYRFLNKFDSYEMFFLVNSHKFTSVWHIFLLKLQFYIIFSDVRIEMKQV